MVQYDRQFIISEEIHFDNWFTTQIDEKMVLQSEEKLEVNQIHESNLMITLVGYLLDPYFPSKNNVDCLKDIISNVDTAVDIFEETYHYTGRFVLIISDGSETIIITDPAGLRQVYYGISEDNKFVIGSQPNLLTNCYQFSKSKDTNLLKFFNSDIFERNQNFWIGDKTTYENIFHLLPNHYLSMNLKYSKRFWVNKEEQKDYNTIAEEVAKIIKGSMQAVNNRQKTIIGLSAGWDTRVILAASKDILNDVLFYTTLADHNNDTDADIKISKELADRFELNFTYLRVPDKLNCEIQNNILNNVELGRTHDKARTIEYFFKEFKNHINVNGNVSEIVRNFYGTKHPNNINAKYLSSLNYYNGFVFVEDELQNWLDSIPEEIKNDISVPDLMYWEQRMGNWAALEKAEQDLAIEDFSPFNNRELLLKLYSLENKYRKPNDFLIYHEMIKKLWPEVLEIPINPKSMKVKLKIKLKDLIPIKFRKDLILLLNKFR